MSASVVFSERRWSYETTAETLEFQFLGCDF
jgi:hypothetical protein